MSINWFTFAFQIVNFVVLVLLLRHFLYRPIIAAMDRRERGIAARMEEAQGKEAQAQQLGRDYRQRLQELEGRRQEALARAEADADRARRELLAKARRDIDADLARWRTALERDRQAFISGVQDILGRGVCAASGKVLRELSGVELESRMVDVFIQKMRAAVEGRHEAALFLRQSHERIVVRTAFPLSAGAGGRLTAALRDISRRNAAVDFERSPDLVCGIEVSSAGQKLGWTVRGYLEALERDIRESLAGASPAAAPPVKGENADVPA